MSMTSPQSGVAAQRDGGLLDQRPTQLDRQPSIHVVVNDLVDAIDGLERLDDHVRARFTSVVSEMSPQIAGESANPVPPGGTSDLSQRLSQEVSRIRAITDRINHFASRSEVG